MKRFLIINTSFFGDILLTGSLTRNIKKFFTDSYLTFIANKPFVDAARCLDGVDEAVSYDKKKEHHGIGGAYKFYRQYKKKFIEGFAAAFVIYGNERGIILAKLFGAQKIYAENNGLARFLLANGKINYHGLTRVQECNAVLLEQYMHKTALNLPMRYLPPQKAFAEADEIMTAAVRKMSKNKSSNKDKAAAYKYICLCTVSKKIEKDMPLEICTKLIEKINTAGYYAVFLGAGNRAAQYSAKLRGQTDKIQSDNKDRIGDKYESADKDNGYKNNARFIDLTDKTTIFQLAAILKESIGLISVDTGTMHLGLCVDIPVLALFYITEPQHLAKWAPDEKLYKTFVLKGKQSSENMWEKFKELMTWQ